MNPISTIDRVWISSLGPCITMTISTPIVTVDLPGVWTEQHPQRPAWIADDTTPAHLLLTAVWVDDSDKKICKMQSPPTPPKP